MSDLEIGDRPDDPIARLLKLAGPRPPVPRERAARVRDAVHSRWRTTVDRDRRRSVVVLIAAQIATAAALAVLVGAGLRLRGPSRSAVLPAGPLVRVAGR